MAVATERHRSYSLLDEEEVAQLGRDYRRTLHRTQPEKLALQDKHITTRHADKQHVAAIDSAFRGIRQYSRFDASPSSGANTAELVLESTPAQMLSALGDDIDRANWAGWTCLMMAAWYGERAHVEALLDAEPRSASVLRPSTQDFLLPAVRWPRAFGCLSSSSDARAFFCGQRCTAVDVAKQAIRKFVRKATPATAMASVGFPDREAILWRLNEAAMNEWIRLASPVRIHKIIRRLFLLADFFCARRTRPWNTPSPSPPRSGTPGSPWAARTSGRPSGGRATRAWPSAAR